MLTPNNWRKFTIKQNKNWNKQKYSKFKTNNLRNNTEPYKNKITK